MILLIFPPFSNPFGPSLGPAFLKSFIEKNTNEQLKFYDFNIKLHNKLIPNELADSVDGLKKKKVKSNYFRKYSNKYYKVMQDIYNENNKKIVELTKAENYSAYDEYFEEIFELIEKNDIKIVGFSHLFNQQIFMSLYLAKRLKEKYNIITIFGGHPIGHDKEYYAQKDQVDFVVYSDGEVAFKQLIECIKENSYNVEKMKSSDDIKLIPNIAYDKKVNQKKKFNLKEQIMPNYDDIDFSDYLSPEPVLNLVLGRGCYWNKCSFCTSPINTDEFRIREIETFVDEIEHLQKKYNVNYFTFEDEMIIPAVIKQISRELIKRKLNIKYTFLAKPSHEKLWDFELLAKSGCVNIYWGVETGNQKVSDLMQKGTTIEEVKRILKSSHNAGILNYSFIMFGFPGETEESFMDTINLIEEDYIDSISYSTFGLQKDTDVEQNPEKYEIKKVVNKRTVLADSYDFESTNKSHITKEKLSELKKKYSPMMNAKNKWTDKINFYRNHMLILNS